ncbi:MBL fold metallo-hydrolase [Slackia exigua]|uniref:MBL fold metallo-hydrolase n=1 Tax=Slackia exigua TaxID=84109 RepID=UPI002002FCB9|nr:MBL fold metallo-hydrolase [Slackia exigua]MCK6138769.1 MBL fold metallo-hydrolase [Slackia exigua]
MLRLHVLASGSHGNASVVEDAETGRALLIDCGISKKAFLQRCSEAGFDPLRIEGVLVTHEHTDHTKGLGVVLRGLAKMGAHPQVFADPSVVRASRDIADALASLDAQARPFDDSSELTLAGIDVFPFLTSHDAVASYGFRFETSSGEVGRERGPLDASECIADECGRNARASIARDDSPACTIPMRGADRLTAFGAGNPDICDNIGFASQDNAPSARIGAATATYVDAAAATHVDAGDATCVNATAATCIDATAATHDVLGFMTDTGIVTSAAHVHLQGCRILAIEGNHDLHMLEKGPYPYSVIARIGSDRGHLSNEQGACELRSLLHNGLERVVALHVSQNTNTYDLPKRAFQEVLFQERHDARADVGFQERAITVE